MYFVMIFTLTSTGVATWLSCLSRELKAWNWKSFVSRMFTGCTRSCQTTHPWLSMFQCQFYSTAKYWKGNFDDEALIHQIHQNFPRQTFAPYGMTLKIYKGVSKCILFWIGCCFPAKNWEQFTFKTCSLCLLHGDTYRFTAEVCYAQIEK